MRAFTMLTAAGLLALHVNASAATFSFGTDPFAGSDAPTTPGRQVVGGEPFITFDIANDLFVLDPVVFGVGDTVLFVNDEAVNLPESGVNVVVLETFDTDDDPTTPFGAGNAANLIAQQITAPGPGFFIYFNSGLDLPRLVFSTDLSTDEADLKILARLTNLGGPAGRDALAGFTEANFDFARVPVPEPATLLLTASAGALLGLGRAVRRRRPRA